MPEQILLEWVRVNGFFKTYPVAGLFVIFVFYSIYKTAAWWFVKQGKNTADEQAARIHSRELLESIQHSNETNASTLEELSSQYSGIDRDLRRHVSDVALHPLRAETIPRNEFELQHQNLTKRLEEFCKRTDDTVNRIFDRIEELRKELQGGRTCGPT